MSFNSMLLNSTVSPGKNLPESFVVKGYEKINPLTEKFFQHLQKTVGTQLEGFKNSKIRCLLSIIARIVIQALKILSTPVRFVEIPVDIAVNNIRHIKQSYDEGKTGRVALIVLTYPLRIGVGIIVSAIYTPFLTLGSVIAIPGGIMLDLLDDQFKII